MSEEISWAYVLVAIGLAIVVATLVEYGRSLVVERAISRSMLMTARANFRQWHPMGSAPKDGTVVEVVGRYPDADAGFPRYAHFHDGEWFDCNRHAGDRIICWAWRPRTDWPMEANS